MSEINQILGNSGPKHHVEHNGERYEVKYLDKSVLAAFEKRLFEKARKAAFDMKDGLTREEYRALLDDCMRKYTFGEFALFSKDGIQFMKSTEGILYLLSLIVNCPEDRILPILTTKTDEILKLLETVIRETFPGIEFTATIEGEVGVTDPK